jgi:hypothetical protein
LQTVETKWVTPPALQLWNIKSSILGTAELPELLQSTAAVIAHEKDINSVTLSPNEMLVCTTSQDKTAKVTPPDHIHAFIMHLAYAFSNVKSKLRI